MVMACEWIVNRMAILRVEKRSEKTRVKQPDSLLNFDMAINHGDHNTEREGGRCTGDKRRLSFFFFFLSKPLPKSNNSPGAGGKRARERATANNNNKMDSFLVRGYLSIPPVFETIPRPLALFVSVVISLVKRVVKERDS